MREIDSVSDAGLRDLVGALLDVIEGTDRHTPFEWLEVLALARDEAIGEVMSYADPDCKLCNDL